MGDITSTAGFNQSSRRLVLAALRVLKECHSLGQQFLGVQVISLVPRAVYWIIPTVEIDSRSRYTVAVSADSKDNVSCHFAMVGGSATQHRVLGGWARRATYHTEGLVVVDIRVSLRRVLSSRVVLLVLVQRGAWGWCLDKKGT